MSSVGDDRPYYYRQRSRTLGPFDLKQIRFKAKSAHIGLSTPVSRDGLDWRTLADFPEVMVNASPGPPVVQVESQPLLPPPAVVAEWLYSIDGDQAGPVTSAEIESLIRQGAIGRQHYLFKSGWQDWVAVGSVAEFSHVLAPPTDPALMAVAHPAMAAAPAAGAFVGGAFCSACGAAIHVKAVICPKCGVPQKSEDSENAFSATGRGPRSVKQAQSTALIAAGYVCAVVSLLILPPVFALIGLIIGIINLTRNHVGHGIAQIVLSIVCGFFGMAIGAALMM